MIFHLQRARNLSDHTNPVLDFFDQRNIHTIVEQLLIQRKTSSLSHYSHKYDKMYYFQDPLDE